MIHIILPLYMFDFELTFFFFFLTGFELTLNLLYINHCYSFNNLEKNNNRKF